MNPGLTIFKRLQRGTGDVMALERGNWPVSEEELRTLPEWLARLLRNIPVKPPGGNEREQFMPQSVPVFQGPHGKYYDPSYSREDERIMAKEGDADVEPLKLAGGSSGLPPGFTAFWPGGGKWEGPNRVAAGSDILGGQGWQYYDIGNPNAPWIGLEGPRGTLGQWVKVPGQERMGRVIDVKQKGYGGFGILKRGQYDRKGNWIPGTGGGGQGGTIPGGPFQGWTPEAMQQWHSGTPPSQMGYKEFTGTTAGPGGTPLAYETTSYNIPGYGWVPRAQLANAQASMNPLDYLNPFGSTSKGGPGTGDPTQRGVGMAVGTLSNLVVPGLGFLTGPLARMVTKMIQGGASQGQIKQAVAQQQQQQKLPALPTMPSGTPSPGVGIDPWGNPADPGEWWSNDFGRWDLGPSGLGAGGYNLAGPGGAMGSRGIGFGGNTVGNWGTAIGFGGNLGGGGPVQAGRYMGQAGLSRPYTEAQYYGMSGPMKYGSPVFGTPTQRPGYEQYLSMWNAPGTPGSSTGPGGAAYGAYEPKQRAANLSRHMGQRQTFQMGTSDLNPGLKIFHRQQLKTRKEKTK